MARNLLATCLGAIVLITGQAASAEPKSRFVFSVNLSDSVEIAQIPAYRGSPERWIALRVEQERNIPPTLSSISPSYSWTDGAACPQLGLLVAKLRAFRFWETKTNGPQIDGNAYSLMDRTKKRSFHGEDNSSLAPLWEDFQTLKPCWRPGPPPLELRWAWIVDNMLGVKITSSPPDAAERK